MTELSSLTVFGQNPLAGAADPGAMLLETVENSRVALVHHRPAKARDVARAGVMALLCQDRRSGQNKRQNEENPGHMTAPLIMLSRDQNPLRQRLSMCDAAQAGAWNVSAREPATKLALTGRDAIGFLSHTAIHHGAATRAQIRATPDHARGDFGMSGIWRVVTRER